MGPKNPDNKTIHCKIETFSSTIKFKQNKKTHKKSDQFFNFAPQNFRGHF